MNEEKTVRCSKKLKCAGHGKPLLQWLCWVENTILAGELAARDEVPPASSTSVSGDRRAQDFTVTKRGLL